VSQINPQALAILPTSSRLRDSLLRLDIIARSRLVESSAEVAAVVSTRIADASTASLKKGLHRSAWIALGLALGFGVILARGTRR